MLTLAKRCIPKPVKRAVKNACKSIALSISIRQLLRTPQPSRGLIDRVIRAWCNDAWNADTSFLLAVCEAAGAADFPILECGSGLTTLMLAIFAGRRGIRVVSLEQELAWQRRVTKTLSRFGLHVEVVSAPLVSYGEFDWYQLPQNIPSGFGLVICDGPPGNTRGGRIGLVPVCKHLFRSGCMILLHDAERTGEQSIMAQWQKMGASVDLIPSVAGAFARVRI